ncbi:rod shape-determining protein MreC [Nonomuraea phyllanthi]|uniref:rod shape-determining protein MreC n=1 Tax=Nonomuraea phyllanthi TaxID=2219224 RepID=UPI0012939B3E|nr:rod shape-determining protein MreC [Nonomuraea phyllanthi]QFY10955.1 rod shape-determining protein MreC [Nonomuraea phyllanthi]
MRRAFVLLVLASGVLLVVVDRTVTPLAPVRMAGSAVYGTLQNTIGAVSRSVGGWIGGSAGGERRVRELEAENARLRAALLVAERSATASGGAAAVGVAAHVVGFGRGRQVSIDAGADAGVVRDVTVLNADGLVGKVTWAGPSTATVSLITGAGSSVGARMAGSGELGLVTGVPGDGTLRLSLFDPNAPLKVGDRVVTLGSEGGRPYVAGVPIGTVAAIEQAPGAATRTALVRPAARLSALDLVTVIVPEPDR